MDHMKPYHHYLAFLLCIILFAFLSETCNNPSLDKNAATSKDTGALSPTHAFSPQIPGDVVIPAGFAGNPIAFFDDYSWKTFIALVWPAQNGQRGIPDSAKSVDGSGPKVFQTYKALWEVFHNDSTTVPVGWNQYDSLNACNKNIHFGQMVLASYSKFGDLGEAGFGNLVGPLIAQNRTYTRYLALINKTEFDTIVAAKLYLRKNLPDPNGNDTLTLPVGSIDIKTSWIDMQSVAHPERYFTDSAWVLNPQTGVCSKKRVGLVGMHIVQKTTSRPQWIWSSFEQVDNIPQDGSLKPFAFHDSTNKPMPNKNPYPFPPPVPVPAAFNTDRLKPIHSSTQRTNSIYRDSLVKEYPNTVWQFYQLVMTQWPLQLQGGQPIPSSQPGTPDFTFPGTINDSTSFANVTMETFDQKTNTLVGFGCMNCHNATKQTDFLWSLEDHAFPAQVQNLQLQVKNLQLFAAKKSSPAERLRRILSASRIKPKK